MDARLQRRIQRYGWDKAQPHYERYWQQQLAPAQDRLLELAGLRSGMRVLDVACGTGLVTFPAARQVGPQGTVTATDISDAMVTHVATEAATGGWIGVSAVRMDAESLQFPPASFDVVLCSLGLMYLPDPLKALREAARVLRSGGHTVVAVWGARARCGWADIFPIVDARVESQVCPMFFRLGTGEELSRTVESAGFVDVVAERLSISLDYASSEDACGAAFAGGPVALAYAHFDDSTRKTAHAEYLASIEPYRHGDGYAIPGEFIVARGVRP